MKNRLSASLLVHVAYLLFLAAASVLSAMPAGKKDVPATMIDSGTFGVFIQGRRVASETFKIEQRGDSSVTTSEIKVDAGSDKAAQTSEMHLTGAGELKKYLWRSVNPEKAESVVEPSEQFLIERITTGGNTEKVQSVTYLLPPSTIILDDNFFAHREILAWKYMAAGCTAAKGGLECKLGKITYGVLIPHQHQSMTVSMEFVSRDKVKLKAGEQELNQLRLQSDAGEWLMWLDDKHRVQRIVVVGENTEILRD